MSDEPVTIHLSHAEALVLFEWLAREDDAEKLPFEDQAEQTVLWKIEGQLENVLIEPMDPKYRQLVLDARKRVMESG